MRHGAQPRVERGEPERVGAAHRDADDAEPGGIDPRFGGEPVEPGGQFGEHLAEEGLTPPEERLGQRRFALVAALAEAGHLDAERRQAEGGEVGEPGRMQRRAAVDEFAAAHLVAAAVGVAVEDGGERRVAARGG